MKMKNINLGTSFMTYLFYLVLIFFVSETADANMAYITNEKKIIL